MSRIKVISVVLAVIATSVLASNAYAFERNQKTVCTKNGNRMVCTTKEEKLSQVGNQKWCSYSAEHLFFQLQCEMDTKSECRDSWKTKLAGGRCVRNPDFDDEEDE